MSKKKKDSDSKLLHLRWRRGVWTASKEDGEIGQSAEGYTPNKAVENLLGWYDKRETAPEIMPQFPNLVVQRVTKNDSSHGGVVVTRLEKEETPYAIVFECGDNADFEVGTLLMLHAHCGHDFTWQKTMSLTIIGPDDVIAVIEGSPNEKQKFIDVAKSEL